MTPADGGAAGVLPNERDPWGAGISEGSRGMSLRDWFAGQALAGMTANKVTLAASDARRIPELAFAFADAMLAERAK